MEIIWYKELDSTQNEVLQHLGDLDNLSVVAAFFQTAGRGQRGNAWLSEPGMNLTASLLVRFGRDGIPPLPAAVYFRLNIAFSLAVAGYLSGRGIDARIKWPNDIFVQGKKICGVLIENQLDGPEIRSSVIGFGLNLNQTRFPSLVNATSVKCLTGQDSDPETELEPLARLITDKILDSFDGAESQRRDYEALLFRKGQLRSYRDLATGEIFEATLEGIDEKGRAVLRSGAVERHFAFKEVGYIL